MASPVLVRAHSSEHALSIGSSGKGGKGANGLPPVSSYAFANIWKAADSAEVQQAIDGIAEICAQSQVSLADEYGSHLPPLGEITTASSSTPRQHAFRPGMRRALTSVPEASSGSSTGSRRSKKKAGSLFSFQRQGATTPMRSMRTMRIGRMGRMMPVSGTTAIASTSDFPQDWKTATQVVIAQPTVDDSPSEAMCSLRRLLSQDSER